MSISKSYDFAGRFSGVSLYFYLVHNFEIVKHTWSRESGSCKQRQTIITGCFFYLLWLLTIRLDYYSYIAARCHKPVG